MKKISFFKILLIVALAIIIIDIVAALFVGAKILYFSSGSISVAPFVFNVFIIILSINAALIILVILFVIFRKA